MGTLPGPLVAVFDESSARFTVIGHKISFTDPRTARAAGCVVEPRPLPVAGDLSVPPGQPLSVLRRPTVVSSVAGTVQCPPPSGSAPQSRPATHEADAPKTRRRA